MISIEKILDYYGEQTKQFLVLVRHFFLRLFINDIVYFEEQMVQKIIGILVLLAIFSGHLANVLLIKYMLMPDEGTSWVEKCYFIFFLMVIMGFITVLEWDIIFPDSRDYSNLMTLPIKLRTFFAAKFASLFLFIGLFALGTNSISTLAFWFHLPKWQSPSPIYGLRFIIVHLISVFAASFFVFFIFALLIGILMTVLGYKAFNRISIYIRALMMIVFVFLMIFFLFESVEIPKALSSFPTLKQNNSPFLYFFPPMWFVGLYESLLGNKDPLFIGLSRWAVIAIVFSMIAFFLIEALGYRRYIKRMQEVKRKSVHLYRIKRLLTGIFNAIFLKNPIQRAVFYFFGNTLKRNSLHKMRLASYMAVSVGLVLVMLGSKITDIESLGVMNKTVLSIPFILSFFLIVGLRAVVNIPVSLEANWIFRMREDREKRHYFQGLKKGIFFFTLIPLFLLLFIFYFFLWGWQNAFLHCLYGLVCSIFLMEIVFLSYRKIPFACSYLPGKSKMHIFWMVYLLSFLSYVFFLTLIEYELLKIPSNFFLFYGIIFGFLIIIRIYQNYFLYRKAEIIYEEEPEPVMVTLKSYE